jgi:hypothetical protein
MIQEIFLMEYKNSKADFFLDLTNIDSIKRKHIKCDLIPCKIGTHDLEFDVIEQELPRDIVYETRSKAMDVLKHKGASKTQLKIAGTKPLGFNLLNIPAGAVLVIGDQRYSIEDLDNVRDVITRIKKYLKK